jgi:hypothetical protein
VSEPSAQLPNRAEELRERHLRTRGLKPRQRSLSLPRSRYSYARYGLDASRAEVVQCNDVIVRSHLAHHFHFSLASSGIRAWLHDSEGNLPTSVCPHVQRTIRPLAFAMGDVIFDAIGSAKIEPVGSGASAIGVTLSTIAPDPPRDVNYGGARSIRAGTVVTVSSKCELLQWQRGTVRLWSAEEARLFLTASPARPAIPGVRHADPLRPAPW